MQSLASYTFLPKAATHTRPPPHQQSRENLNKFTPVPTSTPTILNAKNETKDNKNKLSMKKVSFSKLPEPNDATKRF
jgi:hypothetical protein